MSSKKKSKKGKKKKENGEEDEKIDILYLDEKIKNMFVKDEKNIETYRKRLNIINNIISDKGSTVPYRELIKLKKEARSTQEKIKSI